MCRYIFAIARTFARLMVEAMWTITILCWDQININTAPPPISLFPCKEDSGGDNNNMWFFSGRNKINMTCAATEYHLWVVVIYNLVSVFDMRLEGKIWRLRCSNLKIILGYLYVQGKLPSLEIKWWCWGIVRVQDRNAGKLFIDRLLFIVVVSVQIISEDGWTCSIMIDNNNLNCCKYCSTRYYMVEEVCGCG